MKLGNAENWTPSRSMDKSVAECHIRVMIRTRPTMSGSTCTLIDSVEDAVWLRAPEATPSKKMKGTLPNECFKFDGGVLREDISQDELFTLVGSPSIAAVLEGFNVTLFCYGQTGSGKTHTMYGSSDLSQPSEKKGLTARVIENLLKEVQDNASKTPEVKHRLTMSFLDIYEERVYDLLSPGVERKIREGLHGVYVEGACWKPVHSVPQGCQVCEQALQNRHISETRMNSRSSRSHTICMIKLSTDFDDVCQRVVRNRTAIMTLVDLCGSERVKKSEVDGSRLKEAININSSLSALKSVITALGDGSTHVPYRESKLTWLLKDSLGTNSKVYILAHINPDAEHHYESLSTLRFVSFARTVRTRAVKNERVKTEEEILADKMQAESELQAFNMLAPESYVDKVDSATQVTPHTDYGMGTCQNQECSVTQRRQAVVLLIRGPDGREVRMMARVRAPLATVAAAWNWRVGGGGERVQLCCGGRRMALDEQVKGLAHKIT